MQNHVRWVTLNDIQDALQSGDWTKIFGKNQAPGACGCGGKCGGQDEQPAPVEPVETKEPEHQEVGSIFSLESLQQALAQEKKDLDDATIAFTRLTNEKNARIEQINKQIELEKSKTRYVRKGPDMAVTMTKENAEKLMQELSNIINGSQSDKVTFNIGNLG